MGYEVIDNFLDKEDFKKLQAIMLSDDFPWYFNNHKVSKNNASQDDLIDFQFTHNFYSNFAPASPFTEILNPIIDRLDPSAIVRIKANLTTPTAERVEYGWHTDYGYNDGINFSGKTAVFYVNSNNGPTLFDNGESVDAVENRFLIFDPEMIHTGTSSTDSKRRVVINFNFFKWNK